MKDEEMRWPGSDLYRMSKPVTGFGELPFQLPEEFVQLVGGNPAVAETGKAKGRGQHPPATLPGEGRKQ